MTKWENGTQFLMVFVDSCFYSWETWFSSVLPKKTKNDVETKSNDCFFSSMSLIDCPTKGLFGCGLMSCIVYTLYDLFAQPYLVVRLWLNRSAKNTYSFTPSHLIFHCIPILPISLSSWTHLLFIYLYKM